MSLHNAAVIPSRLMTLSHGGAKSDTAMQSLIDKSA